MAENVVQVTDDNFEAEVVQSAIPVVVDFYADWCGPCKKVGPIIEILAEEYAGKVKVCKLDVDANADTSARYSIRSIPTVKVFKDGQEVDSKTGFVTKDVYSQLIDKYL
jgi:thioredoxin 1